ncbi:MAG: hypothetical protein M0Z41_10595 [Peptococcaceae bacterium]|nr:hypothetical protein [Peptococcaceae bacterium]
MSAVLQELEDIVRRLPTDKLKLLVEYAHGLDDGFSPEEIAEIQAGKAEIARGEWVNWDDLKREFNL